MKLSYKKSMSTYDRLTERQRFYVDKRLETDKVSPLYAKKFGLTNTAAKAAISKMGQNKTVQTALRERSTENRMLSAMNRQIIMEGMLEAIEMARVQADPKVMVEGWREIGRMCGFYAPEVKKIEMAISAKRQIDVLETLSNEELMNVIEGQSTEVVDGVMQLAKQTDELPQPVYADFTMVDRNE